MTFFAAAAVVGGSLISANAAENAADTQAQSARDATAAQRAMFDKQVQLQEPWRQAGMGGLNKLGYLLGLSPTGYGDGTGGTGETADQIRARLAPQFASSAPMPQNAFGNWASGTFDAPATDQNVYGPAPGGQWGAAVANPALDAAVQAELQRQQAAQQAQQAQQTTQAQTDPQYGSLLRNFSMADYQADPGLAFRQQQGEQGLQRAAAASGRLGSGKYLKDAMSFNSGLASQEYGAAFDRFNVNKANNFNRLASFAGIGQTAANQTGAAASNFGSQIGSNIIGAGNAAAAGQVGAANAVNNGLGQGVSMYRQDQLMNRLFPQQPTYGGSGISGGGGFGTGSAFGNQDYGLYF